MPFNLKPCPFCGALAEMEYTPWDEETETGDDGTGWVECTGCHVQMFGLSVDEAEVLWNKRSEPWREIGTLPLPIEHGMRILGRDDTGYVASIDYVSGLDAWFEGESQFQPVEWMVLPK